MNHKDICRYNETQHSNNKKNEMSLCQGKVVYKKKTKIRDCVKQHTGRIEYIASLTKLYDFVDCSSIAITQKHIAYIFP